MTFPRHKSYANSGIAWLGEVPSHWKVAPAKSVSSCNDEVLDEATSPDFEIEYVEISDVHATHGILKTTPLTFGAAPSRARRRVRAGDVLVSTVRTYLRAVATVPHPPENLIASTGFAVIRPRSINSQFLGYLFHAEFLIAQIIANSTGISYPAINASELTRLKIPLPSLDEQSAIVSFLDAETGEIDRLIVEQQRLIELLDDKHRAMIAHAITRGLNRSAATKKAQVEWINGIPRHWSVERGRFLFRKLELPPDPGDGVVTAFRDGQVTLRENRRTEGFTFAVLEIGYQKVRTGDLVIHGMDAFAGAIGVSESDGKCTPEYSVLTPVRSGVNNAYFAHILRLMAHRNYIYVICPSVRERAPRFRFEAFKDVLLPVPPSDEQHAIVAFVTAESEKINGLRSEAEAAISLLQERRLALISAAVTGKIDVRGTDAEKALHKRVAAA